MHGRDVGQKLSYVIACAKFFGSLSLNVNERTKTVQSMPRRRALAMAFAIACIFILNITPFETAYEQYKQTLSKMVFRNYLLITNVNCIFVVVEWIVNKDQVEVLWRSLLNLDKSCEPLSLKCRLRKRTMMSIVGTSAVFHVLFSAVDTWRSADRNSWFSVTLSLSVLVFCGIKGITVVQFAGLLTVYKNYFAQINRVLFNILDFPAEHRANVVKSALVSHQQFYELTLLTTKVSAFPIILLLSDTIIVLSAYLYVFVQTLQEYPLTVSLAWQICYVINTVIIVVIVLLPSELCMHHANNIRSALLSATSVDSNENMRKFVKGFSTQVYHNKLHVTAEGILPLNFSMLLAVYTGIFTYTIFMLQFRTDPLSGATFFE